MHDFAMKNLTGGQLNAIVKKLGGEEGALRFLRGELELAAPSVTTEAFWNDAGVSYMTDNARKVLLGHAPGETYALKHGRLGRDMTGTEIAAHLGGEESVVITRASLCQFMAENRKSDAWFVAILEVGGELWSVSFYWNRGSGGWGVYARPVTSPYGWHARHRLLSRK